MTTPVVAVVGYSDSGKTRVATALVRILSEKGYRIAAVKHCHEGHQMDIQGKDTSRLFAAGAARVVAVSPGQVSSIELAEGETLLEGIVGSLGEGYDLVLAEGFKGSTVPKVLVVGREALVPENVIAVVSDQKRIEGVPCYGFQDIELLAHRIESQIIRGGRLIAENPKSRDS